MRFDLPKLPISRPRSSPLPGACLRRPYGRRRPGDRPIHPEQVRGPRRRRSRRRGSLGGKPPFRSRRGGERTRDPRREHPRGGTRHHDDDRRAENRHRRDRLPPGNIGGEDRRRDQDCALRGRSRPRRGPPDRLGRRQGGRTWTARRHGGARRPASLHPGSGDPRIVAGLFAFCICGRKSETARRRRTGGASGGKENPAHMPEEDVQRDHDRHRPGRPFVDRNRPPRYLRPEVLCAGDLSGVQNRSTMTRGVSSSRRPSPGVRTCFFRGLQVRKAVLHVKEIRGRFE